MQLSGSQTRKRLGKVGLRHTLMRVPASFLCDYLDFALLHWLCSQVDSLHSSKRAASRASELFSARRHHIEYTCSKKCREPFSVVVWLPVALRPHACLFISWEKKKKLIFPQNHWTTFLSSLWLDHLRTCLYLSTNHGGRGNGITLIGLDHSGSTPGIGHEIWMTEGCCSVGIE